MLSSVRRFSLYMFLIIVLFLSASLVLVYRPLQVELKSSLRQNFVRQAENSHIILDNAIRSCFQNALTISSRTAIRQKAYSFVSGDISLEELRSFTSFRWREGVEAIQGVVFAKRCIRGNTISIYGDDPGNLPLPENDCESPFIEYVRYGDRVGVNICTPIKGKDTLLGYDLVLFDVSSMLKGIRGKGITYTMILGNDPEYEKVLQKIERVVQENELTVYYHGVEGSGLILRSSIPSKVLYGYSNDLARKFTAWFAFFSIILALIVTFMVQKRNLSQIRVMKELQSRLSESEARYRLLFDKGADAILVQQLSDSKEEGTFVEANDVACQKLGYSREELLQLKFHDILAPESENTLEEIKERLFLNGRALVELTLAAKNGRRIPCEINAHLFNLGEEATILSVVRDMTQRKADEKMLRESERRYASIFNDNEGVMILVDPETGLIRDANPAACDFYGHSRGELAGRRFSDLTTITSEPAFFDILHSADKGRKRHFEVENITASGKVRNVEIYTTRLVSDTGAVLLFIVHDVSRKVEAEEKAKRLHEELLAISTTDKLTGINNRRHLEEILNWEIDKARRYGDHMSLILFDLDGFKAINDNYGHARGDTVLVRIANECSRQLRSSDFFGRWGGDEFLIVTPVPMENAMLLAEKIRAIMEGLDMEVTASLGVSSFHRGDSLKALLERADKSMYAAKEQGGNKVLAS